MDVHKRILAILFIISGSLQILTLIFVSALFSMILPFLIEHAHADAQWVLVWVVPFVRMFALVLVVFFSLPSVVGGIALLNGKKWALTLVMVLGCFKLFSFPLGTALGIYSIWVYAQEHKVTSPSPGVRSE